MNPQDVRTDTQWKAAMLHYVREVAVRNQTFTADDVWDYAEKAGLKYATEDLRSFGPIVTIAKNKGWIVGANVAPIPSKRDSLHASPRRVWDSLIFNPEIGKAAA
jgi:hypothetical protein